MDRQEVGIVLEEIGTLMELAGENPFRARAFYSAARALDAVEGDVAELARSGDLAEVRGLGPATVAVVRELIETGESSVHRELRERTPDGLIELLRIPGLGAKRIHKLHDALDIETPDELERAAREGRIAELSGFGQKTQEKLLEGVAFLKTVAGRRRQPEALDSAGHVVGLLADHPAVARIEIAGGLRRRMETVDAVELVVEAADRAAPVLDAFLDLPGVTSGERVGDAAVRARLGGGLEVRLRCVAADEFAAAWVHATGSEAHVEALAGYAETQGLRLNEYGLWRDEDRVPLDDEAAFYDALGLAWIDPALREGGGELGSAAGNGLPRLVELDDLRGCFHCHTTYSDGHATVREMAEAALARGWRYLGLADHSQAASYAGGLSPDEIARQHEEIDAWNAERGDELWVFKGIEADILTDGRLDYADEDEDVLGRFDYVVGSIHSSFGLSPAEQTERVLRAMQNPHLTFLGHPTGRILLSRDGYALDMDAVIDAAAEHGVGIEINANPRRLDMDWRHWRRAKEKGVRTAINPDAHSTAGLDNVRWGVGVARKGWIGPDAVVNAWDLDAVEKHFAEARSG